MLLRLKAKVFDTLLKRSVLELRLGDDDLVGQGFSHRHRDRRGCDIALLSFPAGFHAPAYRNGWGKEGDQLLIFAIREPCKEDDLAILRCQLFASNPSRLEDGLSSVLTDLRAVDDLKGEVDLVFYNLGKELQGGPQKERRLLALGFKQDFSASPYRRLLTWKRYDFGS